MSRRIPLWATLIPLALGILVWGFIWRSHKADFEADLRKVLPADVTIDAGGFPYRLEAQLGALKLSHSDAALDLGLAADSVAINRVPWQRDRQVISLGRSQARVALSPLAGATVVVDAPEAQASLRIADSRIARLSAVWQTPTLSTGLLGVPVKAERFEAHLRETPAADGTPPPGPRLPTQAQLVLAGEGVSFGSGAVLKLALDSELTAPGPIKSLAGWAQGGTAEIRSATLSDATGEVARLSATLVPENGRLRIAGTVETVCPATVRAAIAGTRAPEEKRSRMPERIAVQGTLPGGMAAAPRDPAKPPPPVRGQQPPCPALR